MNASERRQRPRIPFVGTVSFHHVLPSKSGHIYEVRDPAVQAKAYDINEDGLCLSLSPALEPQAILKLNFEIREKTVDVYARVVWTNRDRCGLRFIVLDRVCNRAIREFIEKGSN